MPITVNLTGVEAGGPAPWEAGIYSAIITKAEIRPSKSSNEDTLYLELSAKIETDEGDEDRNFRWNTSMQQKSLGRFKQLLMRLGFEFPEEGEFEFDEADLVGTECQIRLTVEPHYRDPERQTNRVAEILGTEDDGTWGGNE